MALQDDVADGVFPGVQRAGGSRVLRGHRDRPRARALPQPSPRAPAVGTSIGCPGTRCCYRTISLPVDLLVLRCSFWGSHNSEVLLRA